MSFHSPTTGYHLLRDRFGQTGGVAGQRHHEGGPARLLGEELRGPGSHLQPKHRRGLRPPAGWHLQGQFLWGLLGLDSVLQLTQSQGNAWNVWLHDAFKVPQKLHKITIYANLNEERTSFKLLSPLSTMRSKMPLWKVK